MLEQDILQHPPPDYRNKVIARLVSESEFETLVERLFDSGIIADRSEPMTNSEGVDYFEVSVPSRDIGRARRFLY